MARWPWLRERHRHTQASEPVHETKAGRAAGLIALSRTDRPQWTPRDYAHLAREGFGRNAPAYRCVRMIAEAVAATPFAVFAGSERVEDDHPLNRLLERPNPEQSGAALFEQLHGFVQTSGNGYLEAVRDDEGRPVELYALRPDRMRVIPGAKGWAEGYDYSVEGRSVRLMREGDGFRPVWHLKLFNPLDDWYGFSPLEAAAVAIDVHNAASGWNKALLDNAARPSGALVYGAGSQERLSDQQFETLKAELSALYAGQHHAGRPLVLDGGLEWKPMSLTPAEMDFIEGKHAAAREIAMAFGVPPQLLGIPGEATYANYREANVAFWRQTVVPLARRTAAGLTGWLGPWSSEARIEVDLDMVPALASEREALWARLDGARFLTDEERRWMAGVSQ